MLISLAVAALAATSAGATQPGSGCPEGSRLVEERTVETETAIYVQPICEHVDDTSSPSAGANEAGLYAGGFSTESDFIDAAVRFARANGWSDEEIGRVREALKRLGEFEPTDDAATANAVWDAMELRRSDPDLVRAAAGAEGSKMFTSGWQSGRFSDCVIFAIATSTSQPYSVVAAHSNELIKRAEWRARQYRDDPEKVFSEGGGLNDYEIALLAETFGQVAAVDPTDYAATVRAGRPVVVPVATRADTGHEIVLARTFRRGDTDWFEIIDPTLDDAQERLYLSSAELASIALAKGLTVSPEPGVPLLRTAD